MNPDVTVSAAAASVCSCCGEPLPAGNLAWDLPEPDPVAHLSEEQRAERIVTQTPQIMTVQGMGNFIRVILPVPVVHDREATFGVWLVMPELREWQRIISTASRGGDAWAGFTFAGRLATALQPWPEIFGSWAQARVPGPNKVARLVHSVDPVLARVLTQRLPEELIRSRRGEHVPGQMTGGPLPNPYSRTFLQRLRRR